MEQNASPTFQLPLGIVSKVDVGRLLRELEALSTFMRSAEVRQPGTSVQLPKTSKLLDEFLEINKKSALKVSDREEVKAFLEELRNDAPTIHMSFSADPSPLFTQRLVSWLRQNIHSSILLQVGLQPTIGAGTVVRTTNQYFDLSLREFFNKKKSVLLAKMRSSNVAESEKPASVTPEDETIDKTTSEAVDKSVEQAAQINQTVTPSQDSHGEQQTNEEYTTGVGA